MIDSPDAARLAAIWDERVEREHAQTERLRDPVESTDPWAGLERTFAPPGRDNADLDPAVPVLARFLRPADTVLDIGAGGGRLAIPLAAHCREVIAVEPSESMLGQMERSVADLGVRNVRVVPGVWEEVRIEAADLVICSHVLYSVRPIAPFLSRMIRKARRRVAVALREHPPQVNFYPLWPRVFGEERVWLPAMPEFRALLSAAGIEYTAHRLEDRPHGVFRDFGAALRRSMLRLFLVPGSENANKLEALLPDCLERIGDGPQVRFKWARPQEGWLVTWETGCGA